MGATLAPLLKDGAVRQWAFPNTKMLFRVKIETCVCVGVTCACVSGARERECVCLCVGSFVLQKVHLNECSFQEKWKRLYGKHIGEYAWRRKELTARKKNTKEQE